MNYQESSLMNEENRWGGCQGTKYQRDDSDLDLAVLFEESPSLMEQMELAGMMELEIGGVEIDLINLNNANLILQHNVLLEGKKVFSRDEIKTADYMEYVFKYAPDARIFRKKFQDDYLEGLKDELQKKSNED